MTNSPHVGHYLDVAIKLHQSGKLDDAEESYRGVLRVDESNVIALHFLGILCYQQARYQEAVQLIGAALKVNPNLAEAWSNYGLALQEAGKLSLAVDAFDKSLQLAPNNPDTLSNRGSLRLVLDRPTEALADFGAALAINSHHINCLINHGNALRILARPDDALVSFDRALALASNHPHALNGRGATLRDLSRYPEALETIDCALRVQPNFAEALSNRGSVLQDMGRYEEALENFQAAIAQNPNDPLLRNNIGSLLHKEYRFSEALTNFEVALQIAPDSLPGLYHRGVALQSLGRLAEAASCFDKVLQQDPNHSHAFGALATAAIGACDWKRSEEIKMQLPLQIAKGAAISPLTLLAYGVDADLQRAGTATFVAKSVAAKPFLERRSIFRPGKIRVAYLSGDLHEHATAHLIAEVFERHDRSRFEIVAISYGPDDASSTRDGLRAVFGRNFHDVRRSTDREVAQLLFDRKIDIAVDLKGHTQDARPGILACRPTPIAVNYLGFPATMAMSPIDYVIADRITLPASEQHYYSECIVHLPVAYQPRDTKRSLPGVQSALQDFGLPNDAFVFCCFNNSWKITPAIFDIWMRLLRSVPDSVLWLLEDNIGAKENLKKAAQARGVAPQRLVFSPRIPLQQHLDRHVRADLFLDTLPYNAHTTASDSLWAGLPLVTCRGSSFAGRVAASLLTTLGFPELIANDLSDYEHLVRTLATERSRLSDIRKKLILGRESSSLFKMDKYTRYLETAYGMMIDIAVAGEAPHGFEVPHA